MNEIINEEEFKAYCGGCQYKDDFCEQQKCLDAWRNEEQVMVEQQEEMRCENCISFITSNWTIHVCEYLEKTTPLDFFCKNFQPKEKQNER